MQRISINGIHSEYISVMDRGLHYGDGVFETIACVNHQLQFWKQHLERMRTGAEKLNIEFPGDELYLQDIQKLFAGELPSESCVIKLLLTRGEGERGYRYPVTAMPNRIAIRSDWPENIERKISRGARLRICDTRLPISPQLAGLKHLNRLENVLARNEWQDEYDEGLMADFHDNIIEGTMSNVFAAKAGVLYTPSLERSGIKGVIRQQIFNIADELGIELRETGIKLAEFADMDEIMLSNSVVGIWPVTEFADRKLAVGEITRLLSGKLSEKVAKHAQALA